MGHKKCFLLFLVMKASSIDKVVAVLITDAEEPEPAMKQLYFARFFKSIR